MRTYPESPDDWAEVKKYGAADWQVEQLKLNPEYVFWGPHEDYMCDKNSGWASPISRDNWTDGRIELNEYNEVVNFYFSIARSSKDCGECDGSGLNPPTKRISDDFYDFSRTGRRWVDRITQDEFEALKEAGRAWQATVEEVNKANGRGSVGLHMHDAINRFILIEARARRLGVWGHCPTCNGDGYVFTSPECRLVLTLWVLHPRKGCSRGWEIERIQQDELQNVYAFLRGAAVRNAERFANVPTAA